jgi:hypothetical protein
VVAPFQPLPEGIAFKSGVMGTLAWSEAPSEISAQRVARMQLVFTGVCRRLGAGA